MKKLVLSVIFIYIVKFLFAQTERFAVDTKDFIQSGYYNLNAFPDNEGNIILMYKQKTIDVPARFFTYLIFNSLEGSKKEVKLSGDRHFIGYAYENSVYTLVFKDDNALRTHKEIFQLLQVKVNGEILKNSQIDLGDEKVISKFSFRGNFYILSVLKNDELVNLRTVSSSNEIQMASIAVDKTILNELEDIGAQLIHTDFEMSNREVIGAKVVPISEKKFRVFTSANIDKKKGDYIHSIILDFNSHEYSTSSLPVEYKSFSYFVTPEKLFLVNTSSTQINFRIYSLENSSKIASHTFNKGNTESIIFDGPVFKNDEEQDFKDRKQKIKMIFSKLSEGSEFVNFLHQSNLNRITIGSRVIPVGPSFTSISSTGVPIQ